MIHSSLIRKEKPDFKFGTMGNSNYGWICKEGNGTMVAIHQECRLVQEDKDRLC